MLIKFIWFSNVLTLSRPDEGYFENVLCLLNYTSTRFCYNMYIYYIFRPDTTLQDIVYKVVPGLFRGRCIFSDVFSRIWCIGGHVIRGNTTDDDKRSEPPPMLRLQDINQRLGRISLHWSVRFNCPRLAIL